MENGGSDADAAPSETTIWIWSKYPDEDAMPLSVPVEALKVAQEGLLAMLKVRASPSASEALGVKLYAVPTVRLRAGIPEMAGA